MANRRLWIVDTETNERILLAKSWGQMWITWPEGGVENKLDDWLEWHDLDFCIGISDISTLKLEGE